MRNESKLRMSFVLNTVVAPPGHTLLSLTARGVIPTHHMAPAFLPLMALWSGRGIMVLPMAAKASASTGFYCEIQAAIVHTDQRSVCEEKE